MHRVSPHPIGCAASPAVSAETVVADGWTVFLPFIAVSEQINPATGYLDDLGVGILEFTGCVCLQFGYPNDEGLPEHPLYEHGLSDLSSTVGEVIDSDWARHVGTQMRASTVRIWGPRGTTPATPISLRHFIAPLKEKTFEYLASDAKLVKFVESFDEAHAYIRARQSE